jgi:hypothetical protein
MAVSAACAARFLEAATLQASARGLSIMARHAKRWSLAGARGGRRKRVCLARAIDRAVRVLCFPCLIANLFW